MRGWKYVQECGSVCQNVKVCIGAWQFVSERGIMYKSVEVCIRAWKYVPERGSEVHFFLHVPLCLAVIFGNIP